jgi:thiamine transporter ThiT
MLENLSTRLSKTSIWKWVLVLIAIFHAVAIAYDLFDIAGVDASYFARIMALVIYGIVFTLGIRFGLLWAIIYAILTALAVTVLYTKQPDVEQVQIAALALYPLNMVFSGILLTATLAIRKQAKAPRNQE